MEEKKLPVITINREYGAGGRSVAKILAEKLHLEWYDYDFIWRAARKADASISIPDLMNSGEDYSTSDRVIDLLFPMNSYKHDDIFEAEKRAIIEIAQKPCIIVGRCSNIICTSARIPCVRVFLYADAPHRTARTIELNEYKQGEDPAKYAVRRNATRAAWYKHYTGMEFTDPEGYDLMLNTGTTGYADCAELIAALAAKH